MVKVCRTCKYYLGGGSCLINSKKECAENDFELWESPYNTIPICHGDCGCTTREEALKALGPNLFADGKLIIN